MANPSARKATFPLHGKIGGLMGIGVAPNGDVWIADGRKTSCCTSPADG